MSDYAEIVKRLDAAQQTHLQELEYQQVLAEAVCKLLVAEISKVLTDGVGYCISVKGLYEPRTLPQSGKWDEEHTTFFTKLYVPVETKLGKYAFVFDLAVTPDVEKEQATFVFPVLNLQEQGFAQVNAKGEAASNPTIDKAVSELVEQLKEQATLYNSTWLAAE